MHGLLFVIPTLAAVLVSMFVVRAGAIALIMTGMDPNAAKFQALSAFTGTGFTTREAELVTKMPMRRRIVSILMILGNAGVVAVIVTATSTLVSSEGVGIPVSGVALGAGLMLVYYVGTRAGIIRNWESFVYERLGRRGEFDDAPPEELMHFLQGFDVRRYEVDDTSPLAGRTLREAHLAGRGLLVIGIERSGSFMGTPSGNDEIQVGDRLIAYGKLEALTEITP